MTDKFNRTEVAEHTLGDEGEQQRMQVGIRLASSEPSAQPVLCNFSGVKGSGGLLLVEFGFLEPEGLNALANAARTGANPPDAIGGQRVCRVALPLDTAAQLAQQLNQFLNSVVAAQAKRQETAHTSEDVAGHKSVQ